MIQFTLKNTLLSFLMRKRNNSIYRWINNPTKYQQIVFENLIKKGKKTKFGKDHKFHDIKDISTFKNNIPLRAYEDIEPYIKKARNNEKNILWPGKVKFFAKSSGTTNNKSKYIPITKDCLSHCHFRSGKDMLSLYENNFPKKNIYNGKGLMLGGSISKNLSNKNGDLSAILLDQFPFWVSYHRVPDISTALMKEWDQKLNKIALQAINENITNITGVPSWMLILLKRIVKISGKKNICEVWPNLELYMHGGVNFEPYRSQFDILIPNNKMNYLEGYNASEGFFGLQDLKKSKGLLLLLNNGIFYEFIEISDYNKGIRETIGLNQVRQKVNYVIIITTNAGLWRYIIGDLVCFTTTFPFRIKITGRITSCINSFGEELMVHNTDRAITYCCEKFNCSISDYTVAPIFLDEHCGCHQWLIEFNKKPENLNQFIKEIDISLKKTNSDYEAKRYKNIILQEPKLVVLENNEFYIWLKENNRLGGQFKIPRLSENRELADNIISISRSFQQ